MSLPRTCNLSREEADLVTECMRCNAPLRGGHSYHGELRGEEYRIILIQCFKCAQDERLAEYQQDKILTSQLCTDAYYLKNNELLSAFEEIHLKVKQFEKEVWFSGLQRIVRKSKSSGMSFNVDGFEFMTFCSAGRCMIQMEKGNQRITVITAEDEDESRMGTQGIRATKEEALALIQQGIDLWKAGHRPKDSKSIGLG